ncbi:MAG: energy-dependent translational throttle protein EttA [Planctomycetes bacterium]|nr:energy-dependent translational throttle protein EttA [Planctomycetota bacterium]
MSDQEIIFSVQDLRRTYGSKEVLSGVTLGFYYGAKIGIIGRNGTGKSTLLRIVAGEDDGYEGKLTKKANLRIAHVPQEPALDETKTVRENIEIGVEPIRALLRDFDEITHKLGEDLSDDEMQKTYDRMAVLQEAIEHCEGWELDRHIDQAMHALDCPPDDAEVRSLSGGEKRRVALCRTLLSHPDVLLLDEPTNHLDAETVAWLEKHLMDYTGTVMVITHDRYFLDNVVGWMLEIDRGKGRPFEGNYSSYLEQKEKILAQEARAEAHRQRAVKEELEWIRQSPRARQKKNKARIAAFNELQAQTYESADRLPELSFPPGKRLGDRVISFNGVTKAYDGRKIIDDLTFELPPGGIIGVIGPNGAGKTTLLRMIVGEEQPDTGYIEIGDTVEVCYVDQSRQELQDDHTVYEEISEGYDTFRVGRVEVKSRGYVARFGFTGEDQEKRVGDLSGGQRNRLQMAKLLRRGGNVVLLDEPTNDLDIPTLRLLEEALMEYPGCAVVVSHDRYFLDRLATHIMAFEGDGKVRFFEGSYQAYAEKIAEERKERGESADAKGAHRRFR